MWRCPVLRVQKVLNLLLLYYYITATILERGEWLCPVLWVQKVCVCVCVCVCTYLFIYIPSATLSRSLSHTCICVIGVVFDDCTAVGRQANAHTQHFPGGGGVEWCCLEVCVCASLSVSLIRVSLARWLALHLSHPPPSSRSLARSRARSLSLGVSNRRRAAAGGAPVMGPCLWQVVLKQTLLLLLKPVMGPCLWQVGEFIHHHIYVSS